MKRMIPAALLALVLLAGGGWWLTARMGGEADVPAGSLEAQENTDNLDTSTIVEMAQGAADAPLTVIEYASYTCPHCASFHAGQYKKLKAEYVDTGKVRFVFREVYFDRFGLWASMVARCGGEARFFGLTDLIFKGQRDWVGNGQPGEVVEGLRKIGRLAGMTEDQLESCLQDGDKAGTLVAWYEQNAKEHPITGTPSFVIGGDLYSNMSWDAFKAILDEKLGAS